MSWIIDELSLGSAVGNIVLKSETAYLPSYRYFVPKLVYTLVAKVLFMFYVVD